MIEKQCTKYLEKEKKTTKMAKHYHFSVLNARHSLLKNVKRVPKEARIDLKITFRYEICFSQIAIKNIIVAQINFLCEP